jgi:type I restriction enzyme, S subunit
MSSELPDGWSYQLLESLCERVSVGHVGETSSFFTEVDGIPFIRSQNVRPNKVDFADIKFITKDFHRKSKKSQLQGGDLLIVRVGQNRGDCAVLPHGLGEVNCANIVFARPNPSYSDFLGAYFNTPSGHEALLSLSSGSAQLVLNTKAIAKIEVPVPPAKVAEEIGALSKKFDDRITLLRETNTTLESIAQVLFKSWFVDFDPVHAKMQGRAPEGMDEATAALFPDNFEESELGLVPKGWSISAVANVAEIVKGKSYSSKDLVDKHTTALVTLKSFERGGGFRMDGFKPYSGTFKPTQVVIPGDLIVAYTDVTQAAELIGKPAIVVGIEEHGTLVASLDVGIVRPDFSVCGRQFLYGLFKTDSFQSHTLAHTSGTTVLHLSKDGVGSFQFVLPPAGLINVFEDIATELAERRQINSDQVRALRLLRDTLLPRLISGQLSLSEVAAETI